jgi:hypothetical protein
MRPPVLRAFASSELVVDTFAGGGGASSGIEAALGRPVDIAIDHDPQAIEMHRANHPETRHFVEKHPEGGPGGRVRGPFPSAWRGSRPTVALLETVLENVEESRSGAPARRRHPSPGARRRRPSGAWPPDRSHGRPVLGRSPGITCAPPAAVVGLPHLSIAMAPGADAPIQS